MSPDSLLPKLALENTFFLSDVNLREVTGRKYELTKDENVLPVKPLKSYEQYEGGFTANVKKVVTVPVG